MLVFVSTILLNGAKLQYFSSYVKSHGQSLSSRIHGMAHPLSQLLKDLSFNFYYLL